MSSKVAYFDCAFGAAGDMLVGACIDCGVSPEYIEGELRKLNLPVSSFATTSGHVHRASLKATKFDVWIDNQTANPDAGALRDPLGIADLKNHEHSHQHEHSDSDNDHLHSHVHPPNRDQALNSQDRDRFSSEHGDHRTLSDILALIASSTLDLAVKVLASSIFERLGRAEAVVHGVPVEQIHFHEVGALDAICDIVGFSIAFVKLGIERAYISPLPLGSGTVKSMHGLFPVPGPAVLALLKEAGVGTSGLALPYECLTPTGAAILCSVGTVFGKAPGFEKIVSVGYGAGALNPGTHPNVVRLIVGQSKSTQVHLQPSEDGASCQAEIIAVIEAHIDDLSPQVIAYAMEKLLQAGALDVSLTPIVMKKGRLAQKLSVIGRPEDRQNLSSLILSETSTIGVRSYFCERLTLGRDFQEVSIGTGPKIRVKTARDGEGRILNVQPEYEDCLDFARESNESLKNVMIKALSKASQLLDIEGKV